MNNIEDKYPTLITLKGLGLPEASFGRDEKIKVKIFTLISHMPPYAFSYLL